MIKKRKLRRGFTLIEMLVVMGIISIISGVLMVYSRGSEKQLLLFKEQEKVVSSLQKARNMALGMFVAGSEPNPPCGYGVHFDRPNKAIVIFKSLPVSADGKCRAVSGSPPDFKLYYDTNPDVNKFEDPCGLATNRQCVEKIFLDKGIVFGTSPDFLDDVIFIPPNPRVYVNGQDENYKASVILNIDGTDIRRRVNITKAGQVNITE